MPISVKNSSVCMICKDKLFILLANTNLNNIFIFPYFYFISYFCNSKINQLLNQYIYVFRNSRRGSKSSSHTQRE